MLTSPQGIYLRQLIKLDKLPDYVDPTAPTELVDEDPNGNLSQPRHPEVFANLAALPAEMTLEPLINVHKQRLISGVVLGFVNCQPLTGKYKFPMDRKLHQRCLRLRALTMVSVGRSRLKCVSDFPLGNVRRLYPLGLKTTILTYDVALLSGTFG